MSNFRVEVKGCPLRGHRNLVYTVNGYVSYSIPLNKREAQQMADAIRDILIELKSEKDYPEDDGDIVVVEEKPKKKLLKKSSGKKLLKRSK